MPDNSGLNSDVVLKIPAFVDTPKGATMRREWTMEKKKQRRKRRAFTPEFKVEAVRLCRVGDRTTSGGR
jgi:hypothetical protein